MVFEGVKYGLKEKEGKERVEEDAFAVGHLKAVD